MARFKDTEGREWVLTLDVQLIKDVAQRSGVRIHKLLADDAKGLQELLSDPIAFVDTLYLIVEDQAKAKGLTPEDFGRGLAGDPLEAAAVAFMEALADFSPSRQRKLIQSLMAKGNEVADKVIELARKKIDALDPATLFSSPMNSPGSSESIPAG